MGVEIPALEQRSFFSYGRLVAQSRMPARGVVPAFDELEAGDPCLSFGLELPAVQQFAFERGKEAFAHCIVVAIADRSNGWTPISLQRSPKATDVYCDPWSL